MTWTVMRTTVCVARLGNLIIVKLHSTPSMITDSEQLSGMPLRGGCTPNGSSGPNLTHSSLLPGFIGAVRSQSERQSVPMYRPTPSHLPHEHLTHKHANTTQRQQTFFFLDPRGGSLSLTHVIVLVDFFVSQPTVFIETSWNLAYICKNTLRRQ